MDGWREGRMNKGREEWMDRWMLMHGQISECDYSSIGREAVHEVVNQC